MTFMHDYKPILAVILVLILVFSFVGINGLHADEEAPVREEEDSSVVGSFFHFVGDVIAFPFRVIGGFFDALF